MQLRRIVTEFPKVDPTSYAFTYNDTATFEEEVDEWFSYNDAEFKRLLRAKDTFERRWKKVSKKSWLEADPEERERFVRQQIEDLRGGQLRRRCKGLQSILHIVLGVWDETAGMKATDASEPEGKGKEEPGETKAAKTETEAKIKPKTQATNPQLEHMKAGIILFAEAGGIVILYEAMQHAFKSLW